MNRVSVRDQSFLSNEGDVNLLLSQHFVDFSPQSFGFVSMFIFDEGEKPRLHYKDTNIVVNGSRKILAKLLAHGRIVGESDLNDYIVSKCKFGNRNQANDIMVTTADPIPTVNDFRLVDNDPFSVQGEGKFVVSSIENPSANAWSVTFQIIMDVNEGNELGTDDFRNYTEMGLFSTNDTMYARKTFPSFVKLLGRKLVVFWTIVF